VASVRTTRIVVNGYDPTASLSNDLKQENRKLAENLASTIPEGNRNKSLLKQYQKNQVNSQNFCEAVTVNPRYHDYDVAYYECVYGLLEQENKFLKSLIRNVNQE
jgi:hypothetical protein